MSDWIKLLVELGLEVWRAVEAGDRTKTVNEIFESRTEDRDKIRALEEEAREHFNRRG